MGRGGSARRVGRVMEGRGNTRRQDNTRDVKIIHEAIREYTGRADHTRDDSRTYEKRREITRLAQKTA